MAIKVMQTKLKEAGFYTGPIDGIYGPKTEAALETAIARATKPTREQWNELLNDGARILMERLGASK